jgi:hypothetical protein
MRTCTHARIRTCTHTHMRTYMCTYTHTYMRTCTHTHMHTCAHTHIHACAHTHMHTWAHAHIRTCTHTHMHTHTHWWSASFLKKVKSVNSWIIRANRFICRDYLVLCIWNNVLQCTHSRKLMAQCFVPWLLLTYIGTYVAVRNIVNCWEPCNESTTMFSV